jgi:hypothetical protein
LKESVILGAYFINKHLLLYDPMFKEVKLQKDKHWTVSSIKIMIQTVVPEYSFWLVKVKLEVEAGHSDQVIAEISSIEEPYLVRGPGLVQVEHQECSLMEVFNTGPEPMVLA